MKSSVLTTQKKFLHPKVRSPEARDVGGGVATEGFCSQQLS